MGDSSFKSFRMIRDGPRKPLEVIGISICKYSIRTDKAVGTSNFLEGKIRYVNDDGYDERSQTLSVYFLPFGENEDLAKQIFRTSAKISHESVLRLWCVVYCDRMESWLLCYDYFDYTLNDYLAQAVEPFQGKYRSHLLHPIWSTAIRELICAIHYCHGVKVLHGDLSDMDNFVMVNDKIKIINLKLIKERQVSLNLTDTKKDMSDLSEMLKKLLATTFCSNPMVELWRSNFNGERDLFLQFMKDSSPKFDLNRMYNHPFLLNSAERMYIFKEAHEIKNKGDTSRKLDTLSDEYSGWKNSMSRALKTVYTCPNSNFEKNNLGSELIHFLRNVATHGTCLPQLYDCHVAEYYPLLVVKTYELLPSLGAN